MKRIPKLSISVAFAAGLGILMTGCGTADHDPHEKIDAPGYYNGPMKSKGKSAAGATDAGPAPAPATGK